ncbi:MAG: hypothetical protein ACLTSX_00105 [Collinsella sp.]
MSVKPALRPARGRCAVCAFSRTENLVHFAREFAVAHMWRSRSEAHRGGPGPLASYRSACELLTGEDSACRGARRASG